MSRLKLSIATTDYDHFRDFRLGTVQAEGIEATWSMLGHHEIFARFTFNREWDAAELSFAKFMAQVTRKNSDIIGLPVVCSRLFRFSSFYVNRKSKIRTPQGPQGQEHRLAGMGAHRRGLHARLAQRRARRGLEGHPLVPGRRQRGRPHREGRAEPAQGRQAHAHRRQVVERDARGGRDRLRHHRAAARLLPCRAIRTSSGCSRISGRWRRSTTRRTKVWPIMHIIALQKRVLDEQSLGRAQSLQRLPRLQEPQRRAADRSGGVALSAGLAADLRAQDARPCSAAIRSPTASRRTARPGSRFLRYTHEQGIAHRHVKPEEIFPKGHHDRRADLTRSYLEPGIDGQSPRDGAPHRPPHQSAKNAGRIATFIPGGLSGIMLQPGR